MAAIQVETKAPTGLKITRNGSTITCSWKIGDKDYGGGQQFAFMQIGSNGATYKINGKDAWWEEPVSNTDTSKSLSINLNMYYPDIVPGAKAPETFIRYKFRVRGKRKSYSSGGKSYAPKWSSWSVQEVLISLPNTPTGTIAVNKDNPATTTFSWTTKTSNEGFQPFKDTEYGIKVVSGGKVKEDWTSIIKGASGSASKSVSTSFIYSDNTEVYFRIRSRGARGASPWVTLSHAYSLEKCATKAPSGLTITRSGNNLTFAWKIADTNYGKGQQLQYRFSNMKADTWKSVEIGTSTTTKTVTIPVADYYPNKSTLLNSVTFRVRGIRSNYLVHDTKSSESAKKTKAYNPQWSAWSSKTFDFAVPNVPSGSTEWTEEHNNETTFNWEVETSSSGAKHYSNVELQTIRVKECNVTDGSTLSWKTTTDGWATDIYGATGSRLIPEDSAILAVNSYTRWVRVRARGVKGASNWRYLKHVYGKPYRAKVTSASATATAARGYICNIQWEAPQNAAHPIDKTTVEYAFAQPERGLVCPGGASWTLAETLRDTAGKDAANFEVDARVELDQCLYLRVNTEHDDNINHGEPQRVAVGSLTNPTDISADIPSSGYTATVTATNNSAVPDSFLVVIFRRKGKEDIIVGIIPNGSTSARVTCPNWSSETSFSFGVYAAQGTYERVTRADSVTQYRVTQNTRSSGTIWTTENVPKAPENVTVEETATNGKVLVKWDWSWGTADSAELAWSDDKNAWQSTSGYKSYKIESKTAKWYIPDLTMGKRWYIRVRLIEDKELGPWSTAVWIDLATKPTTPTLTLSAGRIKIDGNVTASWTYETRDDTPQIYAEVQECTISGDTVTGVKIVGKTESSQALILYPEVLGWEAGSTHNLRVRVTSGSQKKSDWSDPVTVNIASPLTCNITQISLEEVTVIDDEEQGITRMVQALTEMPFTLTVTGAGAGGTTAVYIEREESYHMDKPDETDFNGHQGEAVAITKQSGEDQITITQDDLIGSLDDGAKYRLVATVNDDLGQSAKSSIVFEVRWEHQAIVPSAEIEVDDINYITKITPIAPTGAMQGDTCDIYRLSADKPELIISDGIFGTTYVDPYPTLNEHGGHRIVFKTINGDYITESNQPAWFDYVASDGNILPLSKVIIDFQGEQVILPYNIAISSAWAKDFTETKYLGGSIQGDWNKAVSRTGSINTTSITVDNPALIKAMRKLAAYPGICHVRTPEGSSYAADVQVSESMSYEAAGKIAEFSISITRVDAEGLDGMTLAEWEVEQ